MAIWRMSYASAMGSGEAGVMIVPPDCAGGRWLLLDRPGVLGRLVSDPLRFFDGWGVAFTVLRGRGLSRSGPSSERHLGCRPWFGVLAALGVVSR